MKPPPPIFPAKGYVTANAKPVATAASTALPPCSMMSRPTRLAIESLLTTIAWLAKVAGAPAWKRQVLGKWAGTRPALADSLVGVAVVEIERQAATARTAASANDKRLIGLDCRSS